MSIREAIRETLAAGDAARARRIYKQLRRQHGMNFESMLLVVAEFAPGDESEKVRALDDWEAMLDQTQGT